MKHLRGSGERPGEVALQCEAIPPGVTSAFFVHSGWRTGSTFVWSRFRETLGTISYYEYFNESLHLLTHSGVLQRTIHHWYSKHPACAPYFVEFIPLIQPEGGVTGYDPSMAIELFIPREGPYGSISQAEFDYISSLIDYAQGVGKIAVLTETRSLGRVAGMKAKFTGTHILLYRSIFKQWASFSEQAWIGNAWFFDATRAQLTASSHDPFIKKLIGVFGIDNFSPRNPKTFYLFVGLYLYLYSRAVDAVDLLIDVTKLAGDWRYRHDVETFLSAAGLQVDFSGAKDFFAFSICRIDVIELNGWLNVFGDWIGKSASSAGYEIVARAIAEIRQEVKEHEFFAGGLRSTLEGKIAAVENAKMELAAKVDQAGAKWEEAQQELKALKERETQIRASLIHLGAIEMRQRKELQILQSRSPLQRLLHRNRVRNLAV
jgi:hypothetical protein